LRQSLRAAETAVMGGPAGSPPKVIGPVGGATRQAGQPTGTAHVVGRARQCGPGAHP